MNRREFLRDGLIAGSFLLAPRFSLAQAAQPGKKLIVVGAGLSGLVAAYEMKKLGWSVTILEAQDHVGGRVLTLREFADGQWADAGAARIPRNHDLTHKYVREFNLELVPFYPKTNNFQRLRNNTAEPVNWDRFADATSFIIGGTTPDNWQKIKDGNDNLPRAFAERLKADIKLNVPVVAVEQSDAGVTVKFNEKGKVQTVAGDNVLLAVPMTMLKNIEFTPRLPDAKMRSIERASYFSASRVFIQTKDRFWLPQQLNGFAFGAHEEEIWDSTFGEPGTHGILQTYLRGGYSSEITRLTPDQRIDRTVRDLEAFHPSLRRHVVKGVSKCWSEDPWVKGAWSNTGGDVAMAMPDRRIHFAGEHLSFSPSWMQGALQSGLRVVTALTQLRATA